MTAGGIGWITITQVMRTIMAHATRTAMRPVDLRLSVGIRQLCSISVLVFVQVLYGVLAHSVLGCWCRCETNFGDVLGLLQAWAAHGAAQRRPTTHYTYGFRSASILAALVNALLLLVATGAIAWEAIQRFSEPGEVAGLTVMIVAGIGIAVNAGSALLLMRGSKGDLNVRGAFLHLVADAGVSAVVVLAGGAILVTGWNWLDPLASIVISAVIVWSTWGLASGRSAAVA